MSVEAAWPGLLLVLLPLVWRGHRRAPGAGPRHRQVAAALRCAALALGLVAAMQPVWWRPGRALSVVYLVDASWSVDPAGRAGAAQWIRRAEAAGHPDSSALLVFGGNAVDVEGHGASGDMESAAAAVLDGDTDLAGALEAARARLPAYGSRRLVLASDGRATEGDLERTLRRVQREGVRVDTLSLPTRVARNSAAAGLELPGRIAAGEPLRVRAQVESVTATAARVEVWSEGQPLAARQVELEAGAQELDLELALPRPGLSALELRVIAPGDEHPEDDTFVRIANATARPRVLHVEGRPPSGRYLRRALVEAGLDVTSGGPELARVASLEDRDAVVLSDVPARLLSEPFQTALQDFVSRGGGLVLVGGESVYGQDGYSDTPVEATLPVRFRIREEKRDLALMIVLDKSYSMKGPKMELAKQATRAALELLEERHRFGVVSFDWDPYVTVALQRATEKASMAEAIGRIRASAQTNIFPALEEAFQQLAASDAEVKHVILLSDGRSYPDDYEELVGRMREAEITVSTVAVGAEADRELLGAIAAWGLGRRYAIENAARVQQIFVEEARRALQATLVEEPFTPIQRVPAALLGGVDLAGAPPLRGHVSSQPRDAAEVLLESASGAPVLARWRYGLGTAIAFTSDAKDRWAADWLAWDGYGRFWAQLVRSALRRDPARGRLDVRREGQQARAVLLLRDAEGRPRDGLRLQLRARRDDGVERLLPLPQTGVGRYETGALLAEAPGSGWSFRVVGAGGDEPAAGLAPSLPAERRLGPPDARTLGRIASVTGGRFAPSPESALARDGALGRVPTPLLPWLTGMALVAWLLDIAVRRGPWFWRRFTGAAEALGARAAPGTPGS